ncbi:TRAM domain-containing protein [Candidatus Nanohalococcus occultus]|uniref:TRAM domain-containing protein n=1 Tax=Candidatus Nanohalococcus occultus TaxID=2978047 RepID=UPI0039E150A6
MTDDFEDDFEQDFEDDFEDETQDEVEFDEEDGFEEEDGFDDEPQQESDDFDDSTDDSGDDNDYDKPVEEGETVELEIEDLGSKGDGIARVEGFVVFVPGGEVGEKYDVEITSVGRKFAFGEIEE